jgi:hypothetical protein
MTLKELADELRAMGHAWRYLGGGLCVRSDLDKHDATDWEIVRFATTCEYCDGCAPDDAILEALEESQDAKSFWQNVRDDVEHNDDNCDDVLDQLHAEDN